MFGFKSVWKIEILEVFVSDFNLISEYFKFSWNPSVVKNILNCAELTLCNIVRVFEQFRIYT